MTDNKDKVTLTPDDALLLEEDSYFRPDDECGATGPNGLACTREEKHAGPHVAHVEDQPVAMWVDVDVKPVGPPDAKQARFALKDKAPSVRSVIVVSFFPGNVVAGSCGGFDWWPNDEAGKQAAKKDIQEHFLEKDWVFTEVAFTATAFDLPPGIGIEDKDAVTEWLDCEMTEARELPDQRCFEERRRPADNKIASTAD